MIITPTPLEIVKTLIKAYRYKLLEIEASENEYQRRLDLLLSPEARALMQEHARVANEQEAKRAKLWEEIKLQVIKLGVSVETESSGTAIWKRGGVTWNTDKLDGYAVAHPEILAFRNVGKPTAIYQAPKETETK